MTVETMLALLMAFAAITSVVVEGVKKFLDEMKVKYASNIVVGIVALVIGCGGTAIYYVNCQISFNALTSVYLAIMGIGNWLAAMLGYDKVKQAITQVKNAG